MFNLVVSPALLGPVDDRGTVRAITRATSIRKCHLRKDWSIKQGRAKIPTDPWRGGATLRLNLDISSSLSGTL